MKTSVQRLLGGTVAVLSLSSTLAFAEPERPECIAPAKPGGGFDLTCKLAQSGLQDGGFLSSPMRVSYMPGGIGAVAYNAVVAQRPDEPGTIVAFSGGSLLNLAQKKFGKYGVNDVRWMAAVGADFGMIAVRDDSPFQTLGDLISTIKEDPTSVIFGAGGTVGSQDWMKSALVARAADIDFRKMRYVAFEGGGESLTALLGGHIQAYSGDVAEIIPHLQSGKVRALAVFSDERLTGDAADIPTAKEQGYDISWPIVRGFYVGPEVSDADYNWWVESFDKMLASEEFDELRTARGLFPFDLTGEELDTFVKERVSEFETLAAEFGLIQ
ncbi:tripartite tricarboxylate transporter substrate binding protein [Granulosicoccaceae sp. 1_MG-2023]|nr:tripartite tricarboxylate transporter substrate binding protein [Granulosicoccaceae sp. 1_MG-2023]